MSSTEKQRFSFSLSTGRARGAVPLIRSQGVTVKVRAVDEEARLLNHVLCDHAEAVQHVAQFTAQRGPQAARGRKQKNTQSLTSDKHTFFMFPK